MNKQLKEELGELIPKVKERVMDHVFEIVEERDERSDRQIALFEEIKWLVQDEFKPLVTELEDLILDIRTETIEKTFTYALENSEKLKNTIIGL